MFCSQCGKENQEDCDFCLKCGTCLSETKKSKPQPKWKIFVIVIISVLAISTIFFLTKDSVFDYFPKTGTVRVFSRQSGNTLIRNHAIQRTEKKCFFRGVQVIPVLYKQNGKEATQFLEVSSSFIKIVGEKEGNEETYYEPFVISFPFPLRQGMVWEEKPIKNIFDGWTEKKYTANKQRFEVLGKETVKTGAGVFKCWEIERREIDSEGNVTEKRIDCYTKHLGMVKTSISIANETVEYTLENFKFE